MTAWWRTPDGLVVAGAAVLFGGAVAWMALNESEIRSTAKAAPGMNEAGQWDARLIATKAEDSRMQWSDPALGAADDAWVFDVFTPPVIFYDRVTGRFSVSPPELTAPLQADVMNQPFGVSLVRVVREPFRLQLVGYSGTPEAPLGIFANQVTGAGIVGRVGDKFDSLGLDIRSLAVRREDSIMPFSMPLREIVAVAEVWDEREQKQTRLSSAQIAWGTQPVAEVRLGETGEMRRVQAGNRIETPEGTFEISGVFSEPDSVSVVKHLPNGSHESIKLTPELPDEAQFGGDTIFETP